jgi:hypothetical protein
VVPSPRVAEGQLRGDGVFGVPRCGSDVIAELAGLPEQLIQAGRQVAQANQQAPFLSVSSHFTSTITRSNGRILSDI